jgi:tetratricopeptide (TPR) repeat protein
MYRINSYLFYSRAVAKQKERKYNEALKLYDIVHTIDPLDVDAWNNSGCAKEDVGDIEGAIEDLNRAIKIDPLYNKAYYNLGWIYKKLGLFDLAIKNYNMAISLDPSNISAFEDRGLCYINKKLFEQALDDYRKAIKLQFPQYYPHEMVTLTSRDQSDITANAVRRLMDGGFYINYAGDIEEKIVVMPRGCDRIVLLFPDLHIGETNRRHMKKYEKSYELRFESDFNAVMENVYRHYKKKNENYLQFLLYFLTVINQSTYSTRAVSVALYKEGKLVAGELGVITGRVYTSYTGYHDEPSAGTVQLIMLARYLIEKGYAFWDLGPSTFEWDAYKLRLGAKKMSSEEYFSLFHKANPGSEKIFSRKQIAKWSQKKLHMVL